MKMNKKLKKGFTLVELVVVIAVIAILAGVSVGAYFGITDSANTSKCQQEAKGIVTAMQLIASDPEVKGISLSSTGLTVANAVSKGSDLDSLEEIIEAQTGLDYNFVTADITTATADPTLYIVTGTTGKYSVSGKIATITWATGEVKVA